MWGGERREEGRTGRREHELPDSAVKPLSLRDIYSEILQKKKKKSWEVK